MSLAVSCETGLLGELRFSQHVSAVQGMVETCALCLNDITDDREVLTCTAHDLVSTAGALGLRDTALCSRALLAVVQAGEREQFAELVRALEDSFQATLERLDETRRQAPAHSGDNLSRDVANLAGRRRSSL